MRPQAAVRDAAILEADVVLASSLARQHMRLEAFGPRVEAVATSSYQQSLREAALEAALDAASFAVSVADTLAAARPSHPPLRPFPLPHRHPPHSHTPLHTHPIHTLTMHSRLLRTLPGR